jgi:poly(beta-D-mannuronate) lyase
VSALVTAVASAGPGDRVELVGGSYALRAPLEIKANGIVVAATAGRTAVITGTAGVRVTGSDVTLTGLEFRTADTIEIKADARHVRLTRNAFRLAAGAVNWLSVAGDDAEIDHNQFAGKRTAGVFLQVTGPGRTAMAQRTWVHDNYFADHSFGGSNGGEALRLGVSSRQHADAHAVIEDNLFERVNGDQEAISVKSSGNVIRRNTIRDSKGTITLRHGGGNTVDSNLLIGGTTGIRIFGNDQTVVNNIVQDSARSRSIEVGSGDMRDDTRSSTGHEAADRVLVAFNTVVVRTAAATALDVGDDAGAVHPDTITVADNVLVGVRRSMRYERGTRISWLGNMVSGAVTGVGAGYRSVDPKLARDAYGVYRPVAGSPVFGAALGSFVRVGLDVDGQARPATGRSAGADEPSLARRADRQPVTRATLGF